MFPPATAIIERVRAESENRLLEQEATWRAQMASGESALDGIRRALSNLWHRTGKGATQAVEPEIPCQQTSPAVPC